MKPQRRANPYCDVNWEKVHSITSCTHMHCTDQKILNRYLESGLEFALLSNYYPSAPYYPLENIHVNTFRCRQKGYCFRGEWHKEELDLNKTIAQWKETLDPEIRAQLPFEEGPRMFPDVPEDLLQGPNAEHHWFTDAGVWLHICAPGSMLGSGHFDIPGKFGLAAHGYQLGAPVPWREGFRKLLDNLLTEDGGGIVLNHPTWSHLPPDFLCEMLDYDPRVLGIEVYNHNSEDSFSDFSENLWDVILSTGRQCYGFFTQDHPTVDQLWKGKIILLPEERTAQSCLRAMRQGRFYGCITGNGLRFTSMTFDGKTLRARCNRKATFKLICKKGVVEDVVTGTDFAYEVPEGKEKEMGYLRLTAQEGRAEEKLYAQAIMLS